MRTRIVLVAALALSVALSCEAARVTQKCNTTGNTQLVLFDLLPEVQTRIVNAVANPSQDPALFESLWRPRSAEAAPRTAQIGLSVALEIDPFQDPDEIQTVMHADPLLQSLHITQMFQYEVGNLCFPGSPPITGFFSLTEYYNTLLGHYFMSSTDAENSAIDAGAAGPGWQRTGETIQWKGSCFSVDRPDLFVFRFYSPVANSHFFTADPEECGFLRNHDPGWIAEGIAAKSQLPVGGACDSFAVPVYRLYNDRAAQGDPNHRYTKRLDIYQQMMQTGWIGEGVALCITPINP